MHKRLLHTFITILIFSSFSFTAHASYTGYSKLDKTNQYCVAEIKQKDKKEDQDADEEPECD